MRSLERNVRIIYHYNIKFFRLCREKAEAGGTKGIFCSSIFALSSSLSLLKIKAFVNIMPYIPPLWGKMKRCYNVDD